MIPDSACLSSATVGPVGSPAPVLACVLGPQQRAAVASWDRSLAREQSRLQAQVVATEDIDPDTFQSFWRRPIAERFSPDGRALRTAMNTSRQQAAEALAARLDTSTDAVAAVIGLGRNAQDSHTVAIVARSARKGVDWQGTIIDDRGPFSHVEGSSLDVLRDLQRDYSAHLHQVAVISRSSPKPLGGIP